MSMSINSSPTANSSKFTAGRPIITAGSTVMPATVFTMFASSPPPTSSHWGINRSDVSRFQPRHALHGFRGGDLAPSPSSTGTLDSGIVVLNLEWTTHSRIDALALTADGRIPAPELRKEFQRLRSLEPADTLCPPCHPGALPEMAFFSPSSCIEHFIYYKTGEDDKIRPPPASLPPLPSYSWLLWHHCHGRGRNGKKLDITPHYPRDAGDSGIFSQCLVVSYEKDIMICKTTTMTDSTVKIIPTDDWLHAMDAQTYQHPQASQIRPQCRDGACTNYYRRRKDHYACSTWRFADEP
ncbi:Nn.00g088450.m01.CDS01 [Neocucurbitaria sp. VM-36]